MRKRHEFSPSRRLLPPISALSAFEAVARRSSFTAAAEELSLTQSAISRQVSSLESLLGVVLFEGNRRKQVVMTASGAFYAERIRQLLSSLAAATTEAIALSGRGRALRLGIPPTFGSRWLIPRMRTLFNAHPGIAVEFTTRVPGRPNPGLENLDALIDFAPATGTNAEWQRLMDLELRPVATPELAKRLRRTKNVDLRHIQLLVHVTERAVLPQVMDSSGLGTLRHQPMLIFESYGMLFQAAQAGLGVGLVPMELIESELTTGSLTPLTEHAIKSRNVGYLVYQTSKADYPPLQAFRTWLFAAVNRLRTKRRRA